MQLTIDGSWNGGLAARGRCANAADDTGVADADGEGRSIGDEVDDGVGVDGSTADGVVVFAATGEVCGFAVPAAPQPDVDITQTKSAKAARLRLFMQPQRRLSSNGYRPG